MKVLIVSSTNAGQISPFVLEQVEAVRELGIQFDFYNIVGKGIIGYLKNFKILQKKLKAYQPDLIHAHYGLSGLLSLLAKGKYPLITTFHGNDINTLHPLNKLKPNWNKILSRAVYLFSDHSVFVTEDLAKQIKAKPEKSEIIPCQVNLDIFHPVDKAFARQKLDFSPLKKYVLFSSSFDISIKNYHLAREACNHFDNLELLELNGYTRQEVNLLLNACDLALLTSCNEGSNQFIKEAMACNCPIVSTKVGDAEWILGNTKGCFLTSSELKDVMNCINNALEFSSAVGKTRGRERIIELKLDAENISNRIFQVYQKVKSRCVVSVA